MKKGKIVMLGAAAGAGYGYFYIPALLGQPEARRLAAWHFAILGGVVTLAVVEVVEEWS